MRFNLRLYSELDVASRRLFLFVNKMFSRRTTSPSLALKHLGNEILGYSPTMSSADLKIRVKKAIRRLQAVGVINDEKLFFARDKHGRQVITLKRHKDYLVNRNRITQIESPFFEQLIEIGMDDRTS